MTQTKVDEAWDRRLFTLTIYLVLWFLLAMGGYATWRTVF